MDQETTPAREARVAEQCVVVLRAAEGCEASQLMISTDELRSLLNELQRHRERARALQEQMSAHVERSLERQVRAFHLRFGHPVAHTPCVPEDAQVRFRMRLIAEEFFELMSATFEAPENGQRTLFADAAALREGVQRFVTIAPVRVNLPEFVDATLDLDYVVEGTRCVFGVWRAPLAEEVQRANMAKEPVLDLQGNPLPHSKPTKPASWCGPDIAGGLLAQGWRAT